MPETLRWAVSAVVLLPLVGTPFALWWEWRRPSAYPRRPEVVEAWRSMSTPAQAAHDRAVLGAAAAAEAAAARSHSLYRP